MSFLSVLGKIGKGALGVATGGIGSGILDAIGGIAGGAAKGSADQRMAEAPSQIATFNANQSAQQNQDKRAALASYLGGVQDLSIGRPQGSTIPTFGATGGMRPSAMGNKDALMAQLTRQVAPLEMPKAGLGEKILGGVGLGAGLLGAIGKGIKPKQPMGNDLPSQGGITGMLPPQAGMVDPSIFEKLRF